MKTSQSENKKYRTYGTIGMVVLFLMGGVVGFIINGSDRINHSIMTKDQCGELSKKMWSAINNNRYEEIGQLNKIYSENCLDRNFEEVKQEVRQAEPNAQKTTCEKIEYVLSGRLACQDGTEHCMSSEDHINNAQIYANLSERGCPENSEKYKQLAKQELEIARAINDDSMKEGYEQDESVQIVETYKRLQMQQEAERMIEKAKKLTNPAIDFIIQLEKIIEED